MQDATKTLPEVAPTLPELKKLPMELKCRLLLARLAKIGNHDTSVLNKHNLMMVGDPFALAYGYTDTDKRAVREHLLGAPWTKLVIDGFLVDFSGQGFYKVSDEGKEYLDQQEPPPLPCTTPVGVSKPASDAPRVLLSYSWEEPEHQQWVMALAERLQGKDGVQVIFDQWHLSPGGDKLHFMEQGVVESNFVIVICTPAYAERANKRKGGVGYESMVITAELAEHMLTEKFIPVLRKGDWTLSLPTYLGSKMGVNFTADPFSEDEYEKLLRVLHREPVQPPPIGSKPDFSKKLTVQIEPNSNLRVVRDLSVGHETDLSCDFSPRAMILSTELSIKAFPLISESKWSEEIELSIPADSSEIDSVFSRFRGHKKEIVVAYGFDVAVAKLKSVNRVTSSGKAHWKLQLDPIRSDFANDMEVGTSGTTADEFAEKRVRRLLINENPKTVKSDKDNMLGLANEAMFENLVQGLNSIVKIEHSTFIDLHTDFGIDPVKFLEIAWISAIADLKLSAAIQYIYHLRLDIHRAVLNVDFSGRRHRKYVNVSPYEINVNGSMSLA